ncbi:MAG: hypothetical protein GY904_33315 [Planctomycetaceae bacterium]|nr:hypothetical protein [Planctomycetaceae bacterium]
MRFLASAFAFVLIAAASPADEPLLKPNDRVAILGGTFVERMQMSGCFEAELQCRRPGWKLTFRNLGWSGDNVHGIARKRFDAPEGGFQRLLRDVQTAEPTVVLIGYGFAEASDGESAVAEFEAGLVRLVDALKQPGRRVILLTPIALPGFRVTGYDNLISKCGSVIRRIGSERELPVVSTDWVPTTESMTSDRMMPNCNGYREIAAAIAESLVGDSETSPTGAGCGENRDRLRQLISRKNQLFFHRYRPQNETYLLLFRRHEQGNNASEIAKFDPLIRLADEAIWQAAGR